MASKGYTKLPRGSTPPQLVGGRAPRLPSKQPRALPTVPLGYQEMPSVDTVGFLSPAHDEGATDLCAFPAVYDSCDTNVRAGAVVAGLLRSAEYLRSGPRSLKQRSTVSAAPMRGAVAARQRRERGRHGQHMSKLLGDVLKLDAERALPFDVSNVKLGIKVRHLRRKSQSSPRLLLDPLPKPAGPTLETSTATEKRDAAKKLLGGLLARQHVGGGVLSAMLLGEGDGAVDDLGTVEPMPADAGDSYVLGEAGELPGAGAGDAHALRRGRSAEAGIGRRDRGRSAGAGARKRGKTPNKRRRRRGVSEKPSHESVAVEWKGHTHATKKFIMCVGRRQLPPPAPESLHAGADAHACLVPGIRTRWSAARA